MNVVDSSGWIEYLADTEMAEAYAPALEDTESLVVPTVSILEVFKKVLKERGEGAAFKAAALMHQGRVVDLDASLSLAAARLGVEHSLPLADSIIYATARRYKATVWTGDSDLETLPDVEFIRKSG